VGSGGLEPPALYPEFRLLNYWFQRLIVWSLETVLPARATPTTTLLILSIIAVKYCINIIVTNEENVTTPTKDIANSIVNVTFKLRLFCPYVETIFSMNNCFLSFSDNGLRLRVSFLLCQVTHLSVNRQKMEQDRY
jgi:hypothetical protein